MKEKIETVIIIPNYNGKVHLNECLSSLFKQSYKKFKIVFVDNSSNDRSVEYVKKTFFQVDILLLDKNYGFSSAINKGIIYSREKYNPKYIALLNNDTKVDKEWLKNLTNSIKSEEKIAAVTSNMLLYSNPKIVNNQGIFFNSIHDGFGINEGKKREDAKKVGRIVAASGGAMLINAKFLEYIGLFDDRYFTYHEDLDWGIRANLLGYKILFEEKAIVYHKTSSFWDKFPYKKILLCKRNALCTLLKNFELKRIIKTLPLLLAHYVSFSVGYLFNRKISEFRFVIIRNGMNFKTRFRFIVVPWASILWNLENIRETLKLRKDIQKRRVVPDEEILKIVNFKEDSF